MEKHLRILISLLTLLFFISSSSWAQQKGDKEETKDQASQTIDDLYELSLEELLNIKVTTVSKTEESLSDAPGVITTITAQEINKFGASNLLELLERIPGGFIPSDAVFPKGLVSIRGDVTPEVNNHILVLLNGRPMRESTHGAINSAVYTSFPLAAIERIEVVRGPGSVLYGTNAFVGVINIITKNSEDNSLSARVAHGSFNTNTIETAGTFSKDEFSVSGGIKFEKTKDVQDLEKAYAPGQQVIGFNVQSNYKNFSFTSFAGLADLTRDKIAQATYDYDQLHSNYLISNLGYDKSLTSIWDLSVNATYNMTTTKWEGTKEGASDFLFEITNHIKPTANTHIVLGGLVYELTGFGKNDDGTFYHLPEYTEARYSAYGQIDWKPLKQLKLIAGGQLNKVENVKLDFVPRLGAIYNATAHLGGKLLYGEAFRSPFAVEKSIHVEGAIEGTPDLSPEKAKTLDAQIFYNISKGQLSLTYFHTVQQELIGLTFAGDHMQFTNQQKKTAEGFELETKLQPLEQLFITGSVSQIMRRNAEGESDETVLPKTTVKIGASYEIPMGVTVGVFDNYFGKIKPSQDVNPNVAVVYPDAKSYHYLTANIQCNIKKIAQLSGFPDLILEVNGSNLIGDAVYTTNPRQTVNTYPRMAGRRYLFSLKLNI